MAHSFKTRMATALLASFMASAPAHAAGCWSATAVEAAKVRDLETMMMVSALRCRLSGIDFLGKYNQFVRSSRAALTEANDTLRGHFVTVGSGLNGYDRYVTSLANRYGAGADGLNCRDMSAITDAALHEGKSLASLLRLAVRADVQPDLKGSRCSVSVARAR